MALIVVENQSLKIRSYDSESGQLLGETVVPDFYLPARQSMIRPDLANTYRESYEAYSDSRSNILNLSFKNSSSISSMILSIDFTDGVKIVQQTKAVFDDGEEDAYGGISHISYRNGKLYIIKTLREPESAESRYMYDVVRPKHFYVYVYERSVLVYKGELVTDLNDDNIRAMDQSPMVSTTYDQMDNRYFTNVAVE